MYGITTPLRLPGTVVYQIDCGRAAEAPAISVVLVDFMVSVRWPSLRS